MSEKKPWGGRFSPEGGRAAEGFTASIGFDRRLYAQDIAGSIAHARMLAETGIISAGERDRIIAGLEEIKVEIEEGKFPFRASYEDIHMNIEARLIEKIGPTGGKLHTARSRNDQVALDMHLFLREETRQVMDALRDMQRSILGLAESNLDTIMPGYTHLQRAQPILFAHHLMAYFWMFDRDHRRFKESLAGTDLMPLGAGALAGTSFPIDRAMVARELGFRDIYYNSMDAVSDRDYILEFLAASAICMMHLSRLCEEIILWATSEFGFVEIDDAYSTGSSIMPQKKNPDVAELIRGKAGRVYGNLMALLTVLRGLPLAYHTDLQEDKERLFDTVDTLKASLAAAAGMVSSLKVHRERMEKAVSEDFSNATDLADYLARKGVPFRESHEIVGKAVLKCLEEGRHLKDLSLEEYCQFSQLIEADVYEAIDPLNCVKARRSSGGTAPEEVARNLERARKVLESE